MLLQQRLCRHHHHQQQQQQYQQQFLCFLYPSTCFAATWLLPPRHHTPHFLFASFLQLARSFASKVLCAGSAMRRLIIRSSSSSSSSSSRSHLHAPLNPPYLPSLIQLSLSPPCLPTSLHLTTSAVSLSHTLQHKAICHPVATACMIVISRHLPPQFRSQHRHLPLLLHLLLLLLPLLKRRLRRPRPLIALRSLLHLLRALRKLHLL